MHEVSLDIFFYKYRKWLAFFIFIPSVIVFAILIFSVKPIQDDYATLALVSENGYINFLSSNWQSHGGNIWPMALHAIVMVSALESFNFISISIFVLITISLIVGSLTYLYFKLLKQFVANKKWTLNILLIGTLLGFEGIFTPGLIGAYHFSLASLVHLWPVCFFIIGISIALSDKRYLLGLFLLGILTGNGNISESVAFIVTILLIKKFKKVNNFRTSTMSNINFFFYGLSFGTLLIILAPGFWVRANSVNRTFPESLYTIFLDFINSFLIFAVDLLSHPVLYIFLILGAAYGKEVFSEMISDVYFLILEILFVSLFFCLVVGSVFAYPAWHQNLGLLYLLPVCAFSLGTKISKHLNKILRSGQIFLLVFFICVLFISSIRASLLLLERNGNWKISNDLNICKIRIKDEIGIQNPEITYPPFGLGVEEVQSWPWISDAYIVWIKSNDAAVNKKC